MLQAVLAEGGELAQAVQRMLVMGLSFLTDPPVSAPQWARVPLVVSYGAGEDSTALLIALWIMGIRPDAILFADVGSEHPRTYLTLLRMARWLEQVGFPPLTMVRYSLKKKAKNRHYTTLAGNCLANRTLPGIAFGFKSCSMKWKGQVMDPWVKENFPGQQCYRLIGYDASPRDLKRFAAAQAKSDEDAAAQNIFTYPLKEWGWTRDVCIRINRLAGLRPGKSSCFFCTSMKPDELCALPVAMLRQIVIIEAYAWPNLRTTLGLWRSAAMTEFIVAEGLLHEAEANALWGRWSRLEADQLYPAEVQAETILEHESSDAFVAELVEQGGFDMVWSATQWRLLRLPLAM